MADINFGFGVLTAIDRVLIEKAREILNTEQFAVMDKDEKRMILNVLLAKGLSLNHLKILLQQNLLKTQPVEKSVKDLSLSDVKVLLGKSAEAPVSNRSVIATQRLYSYLQNNYPEMKLSRTIDNGDCYYDAYAQSASNILGYMITAQVVRDIVSDYANDNTGTIDISWLKRILGNKYGEYKNYVREDFQAARRNNRYPVWGNTQVDGRILSQHFGFNLREISEGFLDEGLKVEQGLADDGNRVSGDVLYQWAGIDESHPETIFIGNIPGHYFAIL